MLLHSFTKGIILMVPSLNPFSPADQSTPGRCVIATESSTARLAAPSEPSQVSPGCDHHWISLHLMSPGGDEAQPASCHPRNPKTCLHIPTETQPTQPVHSTTASSPGSAAAWPLHGEHLSSPKQTDRKTIVISNALLFSVVFKLFIHL